KNFKQKTILKVWGNTRHLLFAIYGFLFTIRFFKRFRLNALYFLLLPFYILSACSPKATPVSKKPLPQTAEEKSAEKEAKEEQAKTTEKIKEKPEMVISLILPFELRTIDYKTATLADLRKAEIAIDFYQGFKMGLDAAASQRNAPNYRLQVFDSND